LRSLGHCRCADVSRQVARLYREIPRSPTFKDICYRLGERPRNGTQRSIVVKVVTEANKCLC